MTQENQMALARTFDLSPAEMRVALAIIKGNGTRSAALELGLSWHTIRAYLKTIFDKTGVRRQSALVVLFLTPTHSN